MPKDDARVLARYRAQGLKENDRLAVSVLWTNLRAAQRERNVLIAHARAWCKEKRAEIREKIRAMREKALAELKARTDAEKAAAKALRDQRMAEASNKDEVERRHLEYASEVQYQASLRLSEQNNRKGRKAHPHATHIERKSESDDEVRTNIPHEMIALFERVRTKIKATPGMSRSEAMAQYAHDHPDELLESVQHEADAKVNRLVKELEQREREAARAEKGPKGIRKARERYTPEELAAVPF